MFELHRDLIQLDGVFGAQPIVRRDQIKHFSHTQNDPNGRCYGFVQYNIGEPYDRILLCYESDEFHKIRHTKRLDRWLKGRRKVGEIRLPINIPLVEFNPAKEHDDVVEPSGIVFVQTDLRPLGRPTFPFQYPKVPETAAELLVEALRTTNRTSGMINTVRALLYKVEDRFAAGEPLAALIEPIDNQLRRGFSDCSGVHLFIAANNLRFNLPDDISGGGRDADEGEYE